MATTRDFDVGPDRAVRTKAMSEAVALGCERIAPCAIDRQLNRVRRQRARPYIQAWLKSKFGATITDILPDNVTIASLLDGLNRRDDYVQNVFAHMWVCKKKFGNASVRVGISGEGKAPHYRIEYTSDRGGTAIYGVYRGQGHKLFGDLGGINVMDVLLSDNPKGFVEVSNERGKREAPERPDHFLQEQNWSSHAMSFEEVGALRIELQKRRK